MTQTATLPDAADLMEIELPCGIEDCSAVAEWAVVGRCPRCGRGLFEGEGQTLLLCAADNAHFAKIWPCYFGQCTCGFIAALPEFIVSWSRI